MESKHKALVSPPLGLMDFQNIQSKSDALKCPRCHSLRTKFCYYNNYNYSQPRHYCKTCRRYWTLGGLLRNVPVGGGSRRSKNISKPKPASNSAVLSSDLEMLSAPLKLNQEGDWYGWIKNGGNSKLRRRDLDQVVELKEWLRIPGASPSIMEVPGSNFTD